jgi:hypothetical protein
MGQGVYICYKSGKALVRFACIKFINAVCALFLKRALQNGDGFHLFSFAVVGVLGFGSREKRCFQYSDSRFD